MFDVTSDSANARAFAERCQGDRHHFRFIVAPDEAAELSDLRAFTRDPMGEIDQPSALHSAFTPFEQLEN